MNHDIPTSTVTRAFTLSDFFDLTTSERREVARALGVISPGDPKAVSDAKRDQIWLMRVAKRGLQSDLAREVSRQRL